MALMSRKTQCNTRGKMSDAVAMKIKIRIKIKIVQNNE